jgi:hypothetical protein
MADSTGTTAAGLPPNSDFVNALMMYTDALIVAD